MSSRTAPTKFILIIGKPANAHDFKALQIIQSAPDSFRSEISVAETSSGTQTPIVQDNSSGHPVRSEPGLPALEILARMIDKFKQVGSAGSDTKHAMQAHERKRLLQAFMTSASFEKSTVRAPPSGALPSMAHSKPTPSPAGPATSLMPQPQAAVSSAFSAPSEPTYFSGRFATIGSLGIPLSESFVSKDKQASDIVPRDPPAEVLQRMRMNTAGVLMDQFGALDKRTDAAIETQIDDRVAKGNAYESTMSMGR